MNTDPRISSVRAALEIFLAGVQAADPHRAVHESLRIAPGGRPVIAGQELADGADLRIVAFGKASISMVEATLELLPPERFPGPGIIAVNPENHRQVDRFPGLRQ